jgi:hypothetical protein
MARGLDKIKARFEKELKIKQRKSEAIVVGASLVAVNKAKELAPIEFGKLRQGINSTEKSKLARRVSSQMPYSLFQEYGTRSKLRVPADVPEQMRSVALNYKAGSKGGEGGVAPKLFMYQGYKEAEKFIKKQLEKL